MTKFSGVGENPTLPFPQIDLLRSKIMPRLDKLNSFRGFGDNSNGKANDSQTATATLEKELNTDANDAIIDLKPYRKCSQG